MSGGGFNTKQLICRRYFWDILYFSKEHFSSNKQLIRVSATLIHIFIFIFSESNTTSDKKEEADLPVDDERQVVELDEGEEENLEDNPVHFLESIGKEQRFDVTFVEIEEISKKVLDNFHDIPTVALS